MREIVFFFNLQYGKKYFYDVVKILGDFFIELIEKLGGGICDYLVLNVVQLMCVVGIFLNFDIFLYYGKVNGGYVYNSFIDENGKFFYFFFYECELEWN